MEIGKYKDDKISNLKKIYNSQLSNERLKYNKNINSIRRNFLLSIFQRSLKLKELQKEYNSIIISINEDLKSKTLLIQQIPVKDIKNIKNKKALLIGINYTNTNYELNGCINDVNLIVNYIQNKGFSEITVITDKTELKPTRYNIISSLENFLSNASDNDFLFFHYSGHGSTEFDNSYDEKDNQDETIVSSDLFNIKDDELSNIIKTNLTSNATLFAIFDSCHSGSILDLKYTFSEMSGKLIINEEQKYDNINPNIIMISGCKDNQYSLETLTDKGVGGLMTWAFNDVITKNPNLSWKELYLNIKKLLKNIKAVQIPQLSMGSLIEINDKSIF
jgi:hypothetical protein